MKPTTRWLTLLLVGTLVLSAAVTAGAELLASWTDPEGDDTGDGDYTYPTNEAFGEGWEKECFPYLETGGWAGQAGNQLGRDEAQWDAILDAVKLFKQTHGRFPRGRGGDADETRLYKWLSKCSDKSQQLWTQERANKLALAFGDRWQSECFPKSIWAW